MRDGLQHRLVFIISAPRSGSTVLMRILNTAPEIHGRPEPHLLPPLAHLGFWDTVEAAPFDPRQASQAMRDVVRDLPGGEVDYVDACRAYADVLYGRLLATSGARLLIDKTPANALVLPMLRRLYPEAKVIVLTRHPAAIFVSYAESFFAGDFEAAARFNPILSRYMPAIARFLREDPGPNLHIRFESLLAAPESVLAEISAFVGVPLGVDALEYGKTKVAPGLGDPESDRLQRLEPRPERWRGVLADPERRAVVLRQLVGVSEADLAVWGCGLADFDGLVGAGEPRRRRLSRFVAQRWLLLHLRRGVRQRDLGRLVRRVRRMCDVLLR